MTTTPNTYYDLLIYESEPRSTTHPDNLAALATLYGMQPVPAADCRLLEIGCATAGNLFPMAEALPSAEFVGIDPAPAQIDLGRRVVAGLGLKNVRLGAMGVDGLDESFGKFDYIICHGVYSWVPPAVRHAILATCQRLLTPQGVAYVSYNAQPGWHLRVPLREMLQFHVRKSNDPIQKVALAREFMNAATAEALQPSTTWTGVLRDEIELSRPHGDSYLLHEHIEGDNEAFYFRDFMRDAASHGLQYLCEASSHLSTRTLAPTLRELVEQFSEDVIAREQYLDFLHGRMFRCTLLVHDGVALERNPPPSMMRRFHLSALATPRNRDVGVAGETPMVFLNDEGESVESHTPILTAALLALEESWPQMLPYHELLRRALATPGVPASDDAPAVLATSLLALHQSNLVHLHVTPARFTTLVSERPLATNLTRLLATSGADVANQRHRVVELSVLDRAVLGLLDGTRDRATLAQLLAERVLVGTLRLAKDGRQITEAAEVQQVLALELDASLERLARRAVLVA